MRFKAFVLFLVALPILAINLPQPVCAETGTPGMSCCDASGACRPGQPCDQACDARQLPATDIQVASTVVFSPSALTPILLSFVDDKAASAATSSVVPRWERDFSPPFGGSPPQSVMCLWRI